MRSWRGRFVRVALSHYVTNGVSAALGLALISTVMHLTLGMFAAAAATVGVICTIPPDRPSPLRGKFGQLLPAVLIGTPLFLAVQLLHSDPLRLTALLLPATFVAFLAAAWGRRGIPIAMSIMFSMIFSMATDRPEHPAAALSASLYFGIGSLAFAVWATVSNAVLNRRYRTLLLVDSLQGLVALMRAQALQFTPSSAARAPGAMASKWLSGLLQRQAALADQLQAARDLLLESPRTPRRQRLAGMLLRVLDLRDHLVACALDLDAVRESAQHAQVLVSLRGELFALAHQLESMADALLVGRVFAKPEDMAGPSWRERSDAAMRALTEHAMRSEHRAQAGTPPIDLLARNLFVRVGYVDDEIRSLRALATDKDCADLTAVRTAWQLFTSPSGWSLHPFKNLWRWDAPPLRHALRATLAIGAAQGLAMVLPLGTRDYWILLTITVVLRGSYAQTVERRNHRVAGTVVGCMLAGALLMAHPPLVLLVATVTVAQAVAHSFAVRRYVVTAVAASVLSLVQSHLLRAGTSPLHDVVERMADTLLGVAIAWAFSWVLPSWERTQLPSLVKRTLTAQSKHGAAALGLGQIDAVDNHSEIEWRLARREVYDSLSALVQATQRSVLEPRAVQPPLDALERLTASSYQLLAQLTSIKTMLLLRRGRLNAEHIRGPLHDASQALQRALDGAEDFSGTADFNLPTLSFESDAMPLVTDASAMADPTVYDLSPWLLRRLQMAVGLAGHVRRAADEVSARVKAQR